MSKKRLAIVVLSVIMCMLIVEFITILSVNSYVKHIGKENMITPEKAVELKDVDCIIILGCGVREDGKPSDMLSDRLKRGIELYNAGAAPKIIMSGDHGRNEYDEVNTMKQIAVDTGISSSDIFMDHAGFSTYESMYRTKEIFEADKIIVVTQEYHLYRTLYIAEKLGIEAYGVNSDYHIYRGQAYRDMREVAARCKDFFKTIFKPEPTFLGEAIPVSGDGDITNDK